MKLRFEPWGAWAKLETMPALVALDRDGVRALGLEPREGLPAVRPPIEVHLAVTGRCGAGCEGCYLDARPEGEEPERARLLALLDALRDAGVFTVAFGGGEPTLRDDLADLARAAEARGLTPVLTTSGLGLNADRLERLRAFAQVNVSYDGAGDAYARVRGFSGAAPAERAIRELSARGVRVGVNVVLTRATFDELPATLRRARDLGACEAQLLRYKPAGRAASLTYLDRRLTSAQVDDFSRMLRRICAEHEGNQFHVRIDCALVPFLSSDASLDARRLEAFGVLGCEAADALAAVRVDGRVAPCSFAPATELDGADLATGYAADAELARWRQHVERAPEPCASCPLQKVCKGGCKIVSRFVEGRMGPDPECPRVRAHRSTSAPKGES
jgi:radical SAM protein with 4Fe4S-binding SPASM domain